MRATLAGTRDEGGVAVCDRCGKPRQVRFADVRPEGFEGPNPFGGELLPCECDCGPAEAARRAEKWMHEHDQEPVVAYEFCCTPDGAKRVAAVWQSATSQAFCAWPDGREARMTSCYVHKAICDGRMRMCRIAHVAINPNARDFAELAAAERGRYALLRPIGSLEAPGK